MKSERTTLRAEKSRFKTQLTSLKHYLRELKAQCVDCEAADEHVNPDVMKAEHDIQFYESRIEEFNDRLKALDDAKKQKASAPSSHGSSQQQGRDE